MIGVAKTWEAKQSFAEQKAARLKGREAKVPAGDSQQGQVDVPDRRSCWNTNHLGDVVLLAQLGDVDGLLLRCDKGYNVNAISHEFALYTGSASEAYCDEWTPLTAAAAHGRFEAIKLLLEKKANVNHVCVRAACSGPTRFYTALDAARTGGPCAFDGETARTWQTWRASGASPPKGPPASGLPSKAAESQRCLARAKHPAVEQVLLKAGARPAASLAQPTMNRIGYQAKGGQRQNPCLDWQGLPIPSSILLQEGKNAGLQTGNTDASNVPLRRPDMPPSELDQKILEAAGGNDELRIALERVEKSLQSCQTPVDRQKTIRKLFLEWHPDKRPDCPELATQVFQWIQAAP